MPPFVPRKRYRSPAPDETQQIQVKSANSSAKTKKKKNVFDAIDEPPQTRHSLEDNKAYLSKLKDESSKDDESGVDSDDFEDAMPGPPPKRRKVQASKGEDDGTDSGDEDMDWEEAINHTSQGQHEEPEISGDLELTLDSLPTHSLGSMTNPLGSKKGPTKIERLIRNSTHCMHVQSLMYHNLLRNGWLCDKEIQTMLVDRLGPGMKKEVERWRKACGSALGTDGDGNEKAEGKGKASPTSKKYSKQHKNQRDWGATADELEEGVPNLSRGDPTVRLLKTLSAYWRKRFTITAPGFRKQGWKDAARLEAELKSLRNDDHDSEVHGEMIRDRKELRELANRCQGSRDVGAQLFTALLRGIGLEARMVASLQPIGYGWSKVEEALPAKQRASVKSTTANSAASDHDFEILEGPPAKKRKTGDIGAVVSSKLHKDGGKDTPIDLSDDSGLSSAPDSDDDSVIDITPPTPKTSIRKFDRDLAYPIYWTEALSPTTHTWIPVDPLILDIVANKDGLLDNFEPRGARAEKGKQVMAYVVAFSNDGSAKDVTVRYLKRHVWPGKTRSVRIPIEKIPIFNRRGKISRHTEYDWFGHVMRIYQRASHQRTVADDVEESRELKPVRPVKEARQGGEETLQGYKNSAEFILERFLRREEAIVPGAQQVKTFKTGKGESAKEEAVFRREDVVSCKTVESWHKEGREIKKGEQAMKFVPIRAVTTIRKREIEEAERESGEKQKQGLYAKSQTKFIIPPPIEDGVIPKNSFGNMDVYVPTMIPKGAVHVPLRGTAKLCRRLEIDYAEACTGFEFGNRRAVPILTGVVVAKENEDTLIDAWEADEEQKAEKEAEKREKLVLGTWKRMLAGLRVIERVKKQYGDQAGTHLDEALSVIPGKNGKQSKKANKKSSSTMTGDNATVDGGGFLLDDDPGTNQRSGFISDDDSAAVSKNGGGFIVEDDTITNRHEARSVRSNGDLRTPISLRATHDNSDVDDLSNASESDDPSASRKTTKKAKAKAASVKKKKNSQPKKADGKCHRKPTNELTPPDSNAEQDSLMSLDAARDMAPSRIQHSEKAKAVIERRSSARHAAQAVRSQYFEGSDDDEDNEV